MRSIFIGLNKSFLLAISIFIINGFPQVENHQYCSHQHSHTQNNNHFCGFDALNHHISNAQQQLQDQLEQQLYDLLQRGYSFSNGRNLYTIPVVVHVVHNNGAGNISNVQVTNAIQHLNDAFANTGVYNPAMGVDVEVQFCLAQRDPNGNATNGITNTISTLTSLNHNTQDLMLKNLVRWNPLHYVNIWVVNDIQGGVAGYAYLPAAHGNNLDGIVVEASYMGTTTDNSKVLVHEMGHYLGLYHTFQGGCSNNNCLVDGDRVCDTPPDNTTARPPCVVPMNSCTTDEDDLSTNNPFRPVANGGLGDQNDQKENYMDYSNLVCYDRFTQGQKTRMHFFLTGIRSSLLGSQGCLSPCLNPINLAFSASATTITTGTTVNFNNTTTGATNYNWLNNNVHFSNATNPTFTFNTVGTFTILLEAQNGNPNCTVRDSITITVICAATADFTVSNFFPTGGQVVNITNNSTGATGYQWTLNGNNYSTSTNLNLSLSNTGNYNLCLQAFNGQCTTRTCKTIYVTLDTADCNNTFFSTIGDSILNEYGTTLALTSNGSFFIAGNKEDSSFIMQFDISGSLIWHRTFDFIPSSRERIQAINLDSDGNIIGSGSSFATTGHPFAFKYDPQNQALIWSRRLVSSNTSRLYTIKEKTAGGSYVLVGQTHGLPGGIGCDGLLMEVHRNTGATIQMHHYDLGSCETFTGVSIHNNHLYTIGRNNNAGGGTSQMRNAMSKFDLLGNEVWSRLYISNVNTYARLYGAKNLIENDSIVAIGFGDENGTSTTNVDLHIYKTDLNGNISWAKRYNIPNGRTFRPQNLISTPTGYLVIGYYRPQNSFFNDIFLINTDKQGNVIWSKNYGTSQEDKAYKVTFLGNSIVFVGESVGLNNNGNSDVLLAKLNLNGETDSLCPYISSLNVIASSVTNPYDGNHPLNRYNRVDQFNNITVQSIRSTPTTTIHCSTPCSVEECGNGIDDDGDGLVDCYDPDCCNYCSQDRNKIWYFGRNAGLNFNTNPPTVLTNGQLNTIEGCATMTDPNGNLLFYTDGTRVYNQNHTLMPNGTGLLGDSSSTQSSIVVPHPSNSTLYYIFTVPLINSGNGLRYSIVDMTLNGGLGDVTSTKNVLLLANSDEKVTAIKHCNNKDYWVVSHESNSNNFYVYLLNNSGLNPIPIVQSVGSIYAANSTQGYLKASQDGQRLAAAIMFNASFEVYDFDNATGTISNPITLQNNAWNRAYSVAFSPNGQLLYAASATRPSQLLQFNLQAGNAAAIMASATVLDSRNTHYAYGAIQLAPDGKLYIARRDHSGGSLWNIGPSNRLSSINTPNILGTGCNFVDNAITLLPSQSQLGLPNFIPSYSYNIQVTIGGSDTICTLPAITTYTANITGNSPCTTDSIVWEYYGNNSVISQTDSNLIISSLNLGIDSIIVHVFSTCSSTSDTFISIVPPSPTVDLGADTFLCENAVLQLNAGIGFRSYLWQDNSVDSILTVDRNGLYWVEVVSHCGDTLRDSIVITIDTIGLLALVDTSICLGDSLHLLLNSSFNYSWSPNQAISCTNCGMPSFYPLTTTMYTGVISDSLGCFSVDSFTLTVNNCVDTVIIDTSICLNSSFVYLGTAIPHNTTDTFSLTSTQGLDSFVIITVLPLDTFNITIDTNLCLGDSIVIGGQVVYPNSSITQNLQTWQGCDSIVTINVIGLDTFHTIIDTTICNQQLIYNGQIIQVGSSHTFTHSSSNGCDSLVTVNVMPDSTFTITSSHTNVSCSGGTDGTATVNTISAVGSFTFSWSNGQTTATATGLDANTHSITVTNNNGCIITTNVVITEPIPLQLTFDVDSVSCKNGNNGQIMALPTDGIRPYTYQWGPMTGNQNTPFATGLRAGTYSVTITDFNGCTITGRPTVFEPQTVLTATIINANNPLCNGSNDGSIEVNAQGATPNYLYNWSNGQTNGLATGIRAGTHMVTVTDANGCSLTLGGILSEPSAIVLSPQVLSNFNGSPISCLGANDGSVGVTVSGGIGGYSYIWSPNGQNTASMDSLVEGTYCVTVTDAQNCMADTCITIANPVQLAATFTKVDIFCNGDANGQILVNATPGTGTLGQNGYEYKIIGPGQNGNVFSATNNWRNLAAGAYIVYVRDGNDCEIQLPIQITEPASILIDSVVVNNALCNATSSGSATVYASGGVGNYTYLWSNSQTTQTTTGLSAGVYSVTVADSAGCNRVQVFNVNEPTAVAVTIQADTIPCLGGTTSATAIPTGGTLQNLTTYIYNWSNGITQATALGLPTGSHCVTVTDGNSCTATACVTIVEPSTAVGATISAQTDVSCYGGADGTVTAQGVGGTPGYTYTWQTSPTQQTTQTATGLDIGTYTVIVSDRKGCRSSTSVSIGQPTAIGSTITNSTTITCNGADDGTATVTSIGGTPNYTYDWGTTAGNQATITATGLAAGIHVVTVTDINGCTASSAVSITEPTAVTITNINVTNVNCNANSTGSASVSAQGGHPINGYTFTWSGSGLTGSSVTGLSAGIHNVTATDANGCTDVASFTIIEPSQGLGGYLNGVPALCAGSANGQLAAMIQGGTLPYSYWWSTTPAKTTSVADSLGVGTYSVTVTDANGCTLTLTDSIGELAPLVVRAMVQQQVSCFGQSTGIAMVTSTMGGTPNYSYVWSDPSGQTGQVATGLPAGEITVVVTDTNACTARATVTITESSDIEVTETIVPVSCNGGSDGSIHITSSNKVLIGYSWSNSSIGNLVNGLSMGSYSVTVTDNSGCTATFNYAITEPDVILLDMTQTDMITCFGANNGAVQVTTAGGTPAYMYNWNNSSSSSTARDLGPGVHMVTVTDSKGCRKSENITIIEPEELIISGTTTETRCVGDQTGVIVGMGAGGTINSGLLEYSLDSVIWQTGNVFNSLMAGGYTLYVKDENDCIASTTLTVQDGNPFFIVSMTNDTTIEYLDSMTVAAELNDTVGVAYSWTQLTSMLGLVTDSSLSFIITPIEAATYQFSAVNANGCRVDSIMMIDVIKPRRANAPTAFTPNSDGINDYFFIQGGSKVQEVLLFRVYDRWGELIFESTNTQINVPEQGWDGNYRGQPCSSGVYTWYADVLFGDGKEIQLKGDITLLR